MAIALYPLFPFRYPIRVAYPRGGRLFALRLVQSGQPGVVLARTEDGILTTVKAMLERRGSRLSASGFLMVDLRSPTVEMHYAHDQAMRERVGRDFFRSVCDEVRLWPESEWPAFLMRCPHLPRDHASDVDGSSCDDCYFRVRLRGITQDQLFDVYHHHWRRVVPDEDQGSGPLSVSRAKPFREDEDEQLYAVDLDLKSGARVRRVTDGGAWSKDSLFDQGTPLFHFVRAKDPDWTCARMNSMLDRVNALVNDSRLAQQESQRRALKVAIAAADEEQGEWAAAAEEQKQWRAQREADGQEPA